MAPKDGHVLIPGTHNDLKSEREGELRRVLKIQLSWIIQMSTM